MPFMPWSDEFVLGIDSIDKQHRWLIDTTNRLYDGLASHSLERSELGEILEGLVDYAVNHFVTEEELFNRFGYPEEHAHRMSHDGFTRRALELLLKFENGKQVSGEVLEFMQAWLVRHILETDKAYVPFLKERGVE